MYTLSIGTTAEAGVLLASAVSRDRMLQNGERTSTTQSRTEGAEASTTYSANSPSICRQPGKGRGEEHVRHPQPSGRKRRRGARTPRFL